MFPFLIELMRVCLLYWSFGRIGFRLHPIYFCEVFFFFPNSFCYLSSLFCYFVFFHFFPNFLKLALHFPILFSIIMMVYVQESAKSAGLAAQAALCQGRPVCGIGTLLTPWRWVLSPSNILPDQSIFACLRPWAMCYQLNQILYANRVIFCVCGCLIRSIRGSLNQFSSVE